MWIIKYFFNISLIYTMSKLIIKHIKKIAPKKVWKKLQCSDRKDIFTQENLPDNKDIIVVLNEKSPFHCVELESFYTYWKSQTSDGYEVKNPFINKEIPKKILDKIWRKIKKIHKNDTKPKVVNNKLMYVWIDGEQHEIRARAEEEDEEVDEYLLEEMDLVQANIYAEIHTLTYNNLTKYATDRLTYLIGQKKLQYKNHGNILLEKIERCRRAECFKPLDEEATKLIKDIKSLIKTIKQLNTKIIKIIKERQKKLRGGKIKKKTKKK